MCNSGRVNHILILIFTGLVVSENINFVQRFDYFDIISYILHLQNDPTLCQNITEISNITDYGN